MGSHAHPLRALAGEDEHRPALDVGHATDEIHPGLAGAQRGGSGDTALRDWQRLIAPGGALVVTECEWTVREPSA
ncbi:hypothetical protein, partial [Streptomyces altiplanensis]